MEVQSCVSLEDIGRKVYPMLLVKNTLSMAFTRFSKDPVFNKNPSILIDGNVLDNSSLYSSADMNTILVSGCIVLILFTSPYPSDLCILTSDNTKSISIELF